MSCWKKNRAASSDSRLDRLTNSKSSPPDAYSITMKMCVVVRNTWEHRSGAASGVHVSKPICATS